MDISPTGRLIQEMDDRIHEFDINRIYEWNPENIRKYKLFVPIAAGFGKLSPPQTDDEK